MIVAWLLVLGLLTLYFNGYLEGRRNPNRHPETRNGPQGREVILQRNRQGQYVTSGRIHGHDVEFLLDTGASDVSVPTAVARRVGLRAGAPVRYQTANGSITAYRTRIDRLSVGGIVIHDVAASINPHMEGEGVLLGMTVLKRLDFAQKGGELILRQPAP